MKRFFVFLIFLTSSLSLFPSVTHKNENEEVVRTGSISVVYLTGIGCPNCAETDPVLLRELVNKMPELYLFEYEAYHLKEHNREVVINYLKSYFPGSNAIPTLIVNDEYGDMGKWGVLELGDDLKMFKEAPFPHVDGKTYTKFEDLDITKLPGRPKIWHQNRVLIKISDGGDNTTLKRLLSAKSIKGILKSVKHEKLGPQDVEISRGKISFNNAVMLDGWKFLWRTGKDKKFAKLSKAQANESQEKQVVIKENNIYNPFGIAALILGIILSLFYLIDRNKLRKNGTLPGFTERQKNIVVVALSIAFLGGFFAVAKFVSPDFLKEMGYSLPLPIFTFMIAVVDGFNPCNMFVLTFLLALMVSVSHSRVRIYTVGYTFVAVVYIIYFLFMVAWLNIFKYIGFIDPLRISIAVIALVAGFINCKELFFFKKGVSLTTSEKGANFLQKKARNMRDTIKNGTMPMLILSSVVLAFFASLIELPCTAGFPIVYTSILSGMEIASGTFSYYFWIAIYNLFYVMPLAVVIAVFGYTFRGKAISEKTVQRIKFIGGFIMILLGIVLLVNPQMIGLGM